MKRYFYTDPLAAAWMESKFNMRFLEIYSDGEIDEFGHYTIHPNSLHLLEPQLGDLVQGDKNAKFLAKDDNEFIADFAWAFLVSDVIPTRENMLGEVSIERAKKSKIIQRNGIAFMWPESEKI